MNMAEIRCRGNAPNEKGLGHPGLEPVTLTAGAKKSTVLPRRHTPLCRLLAIHIETNSYFKFRCISKLFWKRLVFLSHLVHWKACGIIFWQMWWDILGFKLRSARIVKRFLWISVRKLAIHVHTLCFLCYVT